MGLIEAILAYLDRWYVQHQLKNTQGTSPSGLRRKIETQPIPKTYLQGRT